MNNETLSLEDRIIDYIKKNKVSSTEIADVLGKRGAIKRVRTVNRGHFAVGKVFWVYAYGGTNWDVHQQLQNVGEGHVVLVETFDCDEKAVFGALVAKYVLLYRQAAAIVVTGNLRDANDIIKENWKVWCEGFNPVGCVNEKLQETLHESIIKKHRELYDGAIAICDDTGVTIIPKKDINEELYKKIEFIEEQEDIWFDCIDRRKMTTFETVCLKKYLEE